MGPIRQPAWWAVLAAVSVAAGPGCRGRTAPTDKNAGELRQMLGDADPAVRAQGAFGLSRKGADAAATVPELIERLKDPQAGVRQSAASALGASGSADAVAPLAEALGDPEWAVRRQAALALGQLGPAAKPALPAVRRLARDPNGLVRKAAAEAEAKVTR
jgi:HEAT repeat protein